MTDYLKVLNDEEKQNLYDALPLITVLIAGADGKIEKKEIDWAEKVAHIRSFKMKQPFKSFYEHVDIDFSDKVLKFVSELPAGTEARNRKISDRLSELNVVFAKLDPFFGHKIYKGFISFAHQVAKASGGVLGFMSISKEEARWFDLPMIDPVVYDGEDEEE